MKCLKKESLRRQAKVGTEVILLPCLSERGITCALFILLACKVRTTNTKTCMEFLFLNHMQKGKTFPCPRPQPPCTPPLYLEGHRKLSGTLMPGSHCSVNGISGHQLQCCLKSSIHRTGQGSDLQADFTCNNVYQWMFPQSLELCQLQA